MPYRVFGCCVVLVALAQAGCGDGGTVAVPCDVMRCNTQCVADGNEAGECRADSCVCRPHLDIPSGHLQAITSGGSVHRESGGFRLDVSVAPVAPVAEGRAGTVGVELGIEPQTDPARGL